MLPAPILQNEADRVAALRLLNILDTQPEERFDRLTRMAKRLFGVPIATVTLIDHDRQWFKSRVGVEHPETPRNISFCGHAIHNDDVMLVPDATADSRFHDNPLVTGDPNIRFYAGCPLKVGAHNLGTLCIIDDKPRSFGEDELQLLKDLADMAQQELNSLQMATTDHLTGLSNRRGFEVLAEYSLAVSNRHGRSSTLLLFDLNGFKQINDVHGHAEGDRALKTFAQGLCAAFRESDLLARLGGDEFVVLIDSSSATDYAGILDRLVQWIHRQGELDQRGYRIRFSVGRIDFDPRQGDSVQALLAQADAAMYADKRST